MFWQFIDGVNQLIMPWFWVWVVAGLVSCQFSLILTLNSPSLPQLVQPNAAGSKGWGQFSCSHPGWDWLAHTHSVRASPTVLPRQGAGSTLQSAAADEGQDHFS